MIQEDKKLMRKAIYHGILWSLKLLIPYLSKSLYLWTMAPSFPSRRAIRCLYTASLWVSKTKCTVYLLVRQMLFTAKVQKIIYFVHMRVAGQPCTIIEVEKHFCTVPSWFYHFVLCCIGLLYWAVWQSDEPTVIFSCQWTLCMLLSGSNLSELNAFYLFLNV